MVDIIKGGAMWAVLHVFVIHHALR